MTPKILFGILLLMVGCFLETSSRPSNNEMEINDETTEIADTNNVQEKKRSYSNRLYFTEEVHDEATKQIIEKIKAINNKLKKPNTEHRGSYFLNEDDVEVIHHNLENIQHLMDNGKLNGYNENNKGQNNVLNNNDFLETRLEYARALQYLQATITNNALPQNPVTFPSASMAYMTSIPVLVVPTPNAVYDGYQNNDINQMQYSMYQTKQRPSLPFNIPWPLAPFFPILIKDPLISYLTSGGFNNLVEYGQNADVCNRKQKSNKENMQNKNYLDYEENPEAKLSIKLEKLQNSREGRANSNKKIKKRTVSQSATQQQIEDVKKLQNFFQPKPVTVPKPTVKPIETKTKIKVDDDTEGDLRTPFGDFTWFGNRKPVAPSPGFFINRLKVRRGGVAIAGPGGVATAGRAGTAVVGPGGLAYTQPGGVAVAGPGARVVALSSDADMSSIVSRLQKQSATDGSMPRLLEAIPEGKLVATGPIVYYHPDTFNIARWRGRSHYRRAFGNRRNPDEFQYNGSKFLKNSKIENPDFLLYLSPVAQAVNLKGVAIANPVSQAVIVKGKTAKIVFDPVATAVVGPGGIAHAQSDLIVFEYVKDASLEYLPFYGGAKGQYLEVQKDTRGSVVSEKIISEEKITSENTVSLEDDNILSKVLGANLQNLRLGASNALQLLNHGKRLGYLGDLEKNKFKTQLSTLGETASNTVKLVEEIGENIDVLFKRNTTDRQIIHNVEEDVGEEGVGIDAYDEPGVPPEVLGGTIIAEAKPIGLAVIGENGLAAARPVGTAVAASGIAIARPIGTAVAGIDPTLLGINFQVNKP